MSVIEIVDVADAPIWASALLDGACRAWALSPVGFAETARRRAELVMTALGVDPGLVYDMAVSVSELATNAIRHGGGEIVFDRGEPVEGLPEVWMYICREHHELVMTIFDTGVGAVRVPAPGHPDALNEDGRGFQIVQALTAEAGGGWGLHPSRSRLGRRRMSGTAAWVALPLPPSARPRAQREPSPDDAVERLAAHLTTRGIEGLISRAYGEAALLSYPDGPKVWAIHGAYRWTSTTGRRQRRYSDLVDVAEAVVAEVELSLRVRTRDRRTNDRTAG